MDSEIEILPFYVLVWSSLRSPFQNRKGSSWIWSNEHRAPQIVGKCHPCHPGSLSIWLKTPYLWTRDSKHSILLNFYGLLWKIRKKHKKRAWRRDPGSSAQNCRTSSDCCRPELGNSSNAILRIVSAGTPSRPPLFKNFCCHKNFEEFRCTIHRLYKARKFCPEKFRPKGLTMVFVY